MKQTDSYENAPLAKVHKHIYSSFFLGQITCSYALGIAGTALTDAQGYLPLNSFWVGLIGAGTLIGLAGSIFVGRLADQRGRRQLFLTDMVIFTILSALQFFVSNLLLLFLIRVCIGLTIAVDYTVGSSLLTEWFPYRLRARYQSTLLLYWIVGFVAAYIVGAFLTGFGSYTWRIVMSSSAVFGLITAVWRLTLRVPESPSWLANQGEIKKAQALINQYLGDQWRIYPEKNEAKSVSWKYLFGKKLWRRTVVGGMFYACQTFPFFGIGIFLPILMKNMHVTNTYVSGVLYNLFMIVGVALGVIVFNRIRRRTFLISTFYLSAILLIIMIVFRNASTIVTLIVFSAFAVVLSSSLVLENPYPPELFDTAVRGSGVGACIAISRIGAAGGTFLLPILTSNFGVYVTLGVCCAVLILGGIICQLWAPETAPQFISQDKVVTGN